MGTKVDAGGNKRDHMARVSVTDSVWAEFKQAAHRRQFSVSSYLGTLMEREVTRLRAVAAREESLSATEAIAALEEVKSLTDELGRIANRLEWAATWGKSDAEAAATLAAARAGSPYSVIPKPPTPAQIAAMTDDELIALGKPGAKLPGPAAPG